MLFGAYAHIFDSIESLSDVSIVLTIRLRLKEKNKFGAERKMEHHTNKHSGRWKSSSYKFICWFAQWIAIIFSLYNSQRVFDCLLAILNIFAWTFFVLQSSKLGLILLRSKFGPISWTAHNTIKIWPFTLCNHNRFAHAWCFSNKRRELCTIRSVFTRLLSGKKRFS